MAQLGRRARQRRTKSFLLAALVIATGLLVIAITAYVIANRPDPVDPQTMCPAKGPTGHYVLLVDKTDPLTFTQKQSFEVTMQDLILRKTPEGTLLSVFVLGEDFRVNAKPLIELCNPGDEANKSEFTANLKQLHRQYKQRFMEPLLRQSESLTATQPAKYSPIFEMLQLVSINAFRKHAVNGNRRLIIISDMLHNTPQYSMYKGTPDYSDFASSDYGKKSQLELLDVEVELHYLMNSPQLQTKRNVKFWEEYFNKAGAQLVSVRPLEG